MDELTRFAQDLYDVLGMNTDHCTQQKFFDWLEQKRIERKTETGRGAKFAPEWKVKVGPCLLKAEFFDKVISAMKHIGATQLFVKDARRTVYAKTDKGTVLLMPVVTEEEETNTVTLA